MNYNLELLYEMSKTFGFSVDRRGIWPVMIMGQKAAIYRTHRDAINFVAVSMSFVQWRSDNRWAELNLLNPAKFPTLQEFQNSWTNGGK